MYSNDDIISKSSEISEKVYNYDEAVDLTGHGWYSYLVLLASSILSCGVAMDMFGFSVVVAAGACDLQLKLTQIGVLASVPFAGIFCAYLWGYYADTRGRRRAVLLSASVGFIMATLSSIAHNWQVMLVFKLLGSFFSTALNTLTVSYLGECTSSDVRNRYLLYMASANLSAECVFYLLAYLILPLKFLVPIPLLGITFRSWRLYTLVLALPLGLGALLMLLLHESPKFLASRGQTEEALQVLASMHKRNGGKPKDFPVKLLTSDNLEEAKSPWDSLLKQTMPLFKPPLLWKTLQLFFLMALTCSNNNLFLMWYPVIVNQFFNSYKNSSLSSPATDFSFCERVATNLSPADPDTYICDDTISPYTIYAGILLGVMFALLALVVAALSRWRKLVLIGILASSAFCLLLTNYLRNPVLVLIVFTMVMDTALAIGVLPTYFVEMFPTTHRAMATSLSMFFTRVVSLLGVNLLGVVIVEYCSITFYACALYVCSGIVVSMFLPSDKKTK